MEVICRFLTLGLNNILKSQWVFQFMNMKGWTFRLDTADLGSFRLRLVDFWAQKTFGMNDHVAEMCFDKLIFLKIHDTLFRLLSAAQLKWDLMVLVSVAKARVTKIVHNIMLKIYKVKFNEKVMNKYYLTCARKLCEQTQTG